MFYMFCIFVTFLNGENLSKAVFDKQQSEEYLHKKEQQ